MSSLEARYGNMGGYADWTTVPDIEMRVPALLRHCHQHWRAHELMVLDDRRITYGQALDQSATLALQLVEAGVGKGSRVGIIFPNGPEFIISWLAITRIGAVVVPISTLSSAAELGRIVSHSDLQMLITINRFFKHDYVARISDAFPDLAMAQTPLYLKGAPFLRQIWVWGDCAEPWARQVDLTLSPTLALEMLQQIEAAVSPADPISIIYSSGSTADPKGMIHSHGALLRQGAKISATYPYVADDRVFTAMPFFWVGGLTLTLLNCLYKGATVLGSVTSGSALLDFLEQERATYVIGWPHMIKGLTNDPSYQQRDFSAIRGGCMVKPEMVPKNQYFANALGMTETCGPHTVSLPDFPDELAGSFGPPFAGMELKIVDIETGAALPNGDAGELLVRGDSLMQGMVKVEREAIFETDGWYRTRDLCSMREGFLFFHGRCDDMIKASGANVSPREVEAAIVALGGIIQAIALTVPDENRGNVVGAIVVLDEGAEHKADWLRNELAKSLSSYKVPRVIITMKLTELPMMSTGKPDRLKLMQMLADRHIKQKEAHAAALAG